MNRTHIFATLLFATTMGTLLGACDNDNDPYASLVVSDTIVAPEGNSVELSISANGTWVLTSSELWLTLSEKAGTDNGTSTAKAYINNSTEMRSAILTLSSGSARSEVVIYQYPTDIAKIDTAQAIEYTGRLELPMLNANNTFVDHYATVEGKKVINYSIEWNAKLKHAEWVAYVFNKDNSAQNVTRTNAWSVDLDLPESMRTDNTYHTNDGFDRGHLCASNDRTYSTETCDQTFYFSNMSPQLHEFNSGIWEKLEQKLQAWGKETQSGKADTLYVVKGGTLDDLMTNYTGQNKGQDGVTPTTDSNGLTIKGLPVPHYYYMAILSLSAGKYKAIAFLADHTLNISDATVADMKATAVSIDALEEKTGLDFFCALPDDIEAEVEASVDLDSWTW